MVNLLADAAGWEHGQVQDGEAARNVLLSREGASVGTAAAVVTHLQQVQPVQVIHCLVSHVMQPSAPSRQHPVRVLQQQHWVFEATETDGVSAR